ncbi:nuclear transport factor 2 family protein [Nocardia sp. XZ_19_369]|uniref:nuclear transport factor 2 family protein n=1 Tax=Nocardia sp. XZ_19_369 TaxID=2769487 RepID=UPI001E45F27B|nr:nuclear transport factor 2 family protein [Nocardia sp. XZ_19_369]
MTSSTNIADHQLVLELIERWRSAELAGDTAKLGHLLAEDFVGIGPMGWLRTKDQWLDKYRSGTVRNDAFDLSDIVIHPIGSATLVVAHQSQRGVNGAADTTGEFRFSLTMVEDRIRSIHVTRITAPS